MNYEREILLILREAGTKGLPVRNIALHVFNMTNSLFNPLDRDTVYNDVAEWLRHTSNCSTASVEKADTRGWYRLNINSNQVQQLLLEFVPDEEDEWML